MREQIAPTPRPGGGHRTFRPATRLSPCAPAWADSLAFYEHGARCQLSDPQWRAGCASIAQSLKPYAAQWEDVTCNRSDDLRPCPGRKTGPETGPLRRVLGGWHAKEAADFPPLWDMPDLVKAERGPARVLEHADRLARERQAQADRAAVERRMSQRARDEARADAWSQAAQAAHQAAYGFADGGEPSRHRGHGRERAR